MDREKEIISLRGKGWSWRSIAVTFGVSRSRVYQIGSGYKKNKNLWNRIFERDNFSCQYPMCNKEQGDLIIHHLDGNDRNNNIDNLITMHRHCHTSYHCGFENISNNGHRKTTKIKPCPICNKDIIISKKFCGKECKAKYLYNKQKRICELCGKEYKVFNYVHKTRWCSKKCHGKWLGGHYITKYLLTINKT